MKQSIYKITQNRKLTDDVMFMSLLGCVTEITRPGQFINIKVEGCFLRRPISVCNVTKTNTTTGEGIITIIYKVVGKGTERMAKMTVGDTLDVLTGLGNGYDLSLSGDRPLLIGGGVGVPPMYMLAKELIAQGKDVTVILGFNKASEIFYEDEFRALGALTYVSTVDGSVGVKGFVTDVVELMDYSYFYTCGPEPMLKAVYKCSGGKSGQFSFEERMGCGFGACMGCSCKTLYGNKRICKDGPVLQKEEIIWQK